MCRACGIRHNSLTSRRPSGDAAATAAAEVNQNRGWNDSNVGGGGSSGLATESVAAPGSEGRSLSTKEYEQEMSSLRKENFNLKLKLYMYEEQQGVISSGEPLFDLKQANMDLKVENESLKKTVYDKQQLVSQASQAFLELESVYGAQLQALVDQQEETVEKMAGLQQSLEEYQFRCAGLEEELTKFKQKAPTSDLTMLCDIAFPSSSTPVEPNNREASVDHVTVSSAASDAGQEYAAGTSNVTYNTITNTVPNTNTNVQHASLFFPPPQHTTSNVFNTWSAAQHPADAKQGPLQCEIQGLRNLLEEKDRQYNKLVAEVQPQVESSKAQICELGTVIEEKDSKIAEQNKVLVEIQISLDEKLRQISDLEKSLATTKQRLAELENRMECDVASNMEVIGEEKNQLSSEKEILSAALNIEKQKFVDLEKDFNKSVAQLKNFAVEAKKRDREMERLQKENKKLDKKCKTLVCELKEQVDVLSRAKWEAQTGGVSSPHASMSEDEQENLWNELEGYRKELQEMKQNCNKLTNELTIAKKHEAKHDCAAIEAQLAVANSTLRSLRSLSTGEPNPVVNSADANSMPVQRESPDKNHYADRKGDVTVNVSIQQAGSHFQSDTVVQRDSEARFEVLEKSKHESSSLILKCSHCGNKTQSSNQIYLDQPTITNEMFGCGVPSDVSYYKSDSTGMQMVAICSKLILQLNEENDAYNLKIDEYQAGYLKVAGNLRLSNGMCKLLQKRLEELQSFMEEVLKLDADGQINLSMMKGLSRSILQKSLDDTRRLSMSINKVNESILTVSMLNESEMDVSKLADLTSLVDASIVNDDVSFFLDNTVPLSDPPSFPSFIALIKAFSQDINAQLKHLRATCSPQHDTLKAPTIDQQTGSINFEMPISKKSKNSGSNNENFSMSSYSIAEQNAGSINIKADKMVQLRTDELNNRNVSLELNQNRSPLKEKKENSKNSRESKSCDPFINYGHEPSFKLTNDNQFGKENYPPVPTAPIIPLQNVNVAKSALSSTQEAYDTNGDMLFLSGEESKLHGLESRLRQCELEKSQIMEQLAQACSRIEELNGILTEKSILLPSGKSTVNDRCSIEKIEHEGDRSFECESLGGKSEKMGDMRQTSETSFADVNSNEGSLAICRSCNAQEAIQLNENKVLALTKDKMVWLNEKSRLESKLQSIEIQMKQVQACLFELPHLGISLELFQAGDIVMAFKKLSAQIAHLQTLNTALQNEKAKIAKQYSEFEAIGKLKANNDVSVHVLRGSSDAHVSPESYDRLKIDLNSLQQNYDQLNELYRVVLEQENSSRQELYDSIELQRKLQDEIETLTEQYEEKLMKIQEEALAQVSDLELRLLKRHADPHFSSEQKRYEEKLEELEKRTKTECEKMEQKVVDLSVRLDAEKKTKEALRAEVISLKASKSDRDENLVPHNLDIQMGLNDIRVSSDVSRALEGNITSRNRVVLDEHMNDRLQPLTNNFFSISPKRCMSLEAIAEDDDAASIVSERRVKSAGGDLRYKSSHDYISNSTPDEHLVSIASTYPTNRPCSVPAHSTLVTENQNLIKRLGELVNKLRESEITLVKQQKKIVSQAQRKEKMDLAVGRELLKTKKVLAKAQEMVHKQKLPRENC